VVDLTLPNTRTKGDDQRFIDRVCAPSEQQLIRQSDHPTLTLWCLWTAKETAYKIVLKRDVNTLFAKKKFVVDAPISISDSNYQGIVRYEDMVMPLQWTLTEQSLHCIGHWPEASLEFASISTSVLMENDPQLHDIKLSEDELTSVRNNTSKSARQLAKQLLIQRGFDQAEIIRERVDDYWKAPRIWVDGEQLYDSTLSISHHGQFVAAAVWTKP